MGERDAISVDDTRSFDALCLDLPAHKDILVHLHVFIKCLCYHWHMVGTALG